MDRSLRVRSCEFAEAGAVIAPTPELTAENAKSTLVGLALLVLAFGFYQAHLYSLSQECVERGHDWQYDEGEIVCARCGTTPYTR